MYPTLAYTSLTSYRLAIIHIQVVYSPIILGGCTNTSFRNCGSVYAQSCDRAVSRYNRSQVKGTEPTGVALCHLKAVSNHSMTECTHRWQLGMVCPHICQHLFKPENNIHHFTVIHPSTIYVATILSLI